LLSVEARVPLFFFVTIVLGSSLMLEERVAFFFVAVVVVVVFASLTLEERVEARLDLVTRLAFLGAALVVG
jgi:hypothetical protein